MRLLALGVIVSLASTLGAVPASADRSVYVPDYQCVHVLVPTADPDTEVCSVDLGIGTHDIDLDSVIGTNGSFALSIVDAEGDLAWRDECSVSSTVVLDREHSCRGSGGWSSSARVERTSSRTVIVLHEDGLRVRITQPGTLNLRAGPGDGLLLLTGRRLPL